MAKRHPKSNYKKTCPSISDNVEKFMKQNDRRIEYCEYDRKRARRQRDSSGAVIQYTPSQEDSFDRLMDAGYQFEQVEESIEDRVIRVVLLQKLHECLPMLAESEHDLINALFFLGMTERQYAEKLGVSQVAVHKRKRRICENLRGLIEKI